MYLSEEIVKKRAATLLALERHGIYSQELKEKILRRVIPDSWKIYDWLEEKGLHSYTCPYDYWNEVLEAIIARGEGHLEDEFGFDFWERAWLRRATLALGLEYEDIGEGCKPCRRCVNIFAPKGWYFDPDRQVEPMLVCTSCDKLVLKEDIVHNKGWAGAQVCSECCKAGCEDLDYSEDSDPSENLSVFEPQEEETLFYPIGL